MTNEVISVELVLDELILLKGIEWIRGYCDKKLAALEQPMNEIALEVAKQILQEKKTKKNNKKGN